jgi:hypothetical protein
MVKFLTPRNIDKFHELANERCLLVPVLRDTHVHWNLTSPSFVYVYGLESHAEWCVGFTHNDCENAAISVLSPFLCKPNYLYQKKIFVDCAPCGDAETVFWMQTGQRLNEVVSIPQICHEYWRTFAGRKNINDFIPVMRWLEYCKDVKDVFVAACRGFDFDVSFRRMERMVLNFAEIDKAGLHTANGLVYCNYNPFTATNRPSNYFAGVNYAALEKNELVRAKYISRFGDAGMLVEFDFRAFHLYLVYLLHGKEMPVDIYTRLGKELYFGTDGELTESQVQQSKILTFRQLYGHINVEYEEHPTFKMVSALQTLFWDTYNSGELRTLLFNREVKFPKTIDKTKLFNYMLQNFETEFCSVLIDKLLTLLKDKRSKLMLYVYDSFLFDVHVTEAAMLLPQIKNIFKSIPHTIKHGKNYWELTKR